MAPNLPSVATGKVVFFHYSLRNDAGDLLDSSTSGDPMLYLHGAENLVAGLERQMEGHRVGDRFSAVVPPEEGYGLREDEGPVPVPRSAFPDDAEIETGMQFVGEDAEGNKAVLWVARVDDDTVFVDTNHPLAGQTLHFDVEILAIRESTTDEREHGHPHLPGHSHP